jgi:hypothetical protein
VRVAQLAGEVDARYDPEVIAYVYTGIGNFVGMRWADWTAGGRVPDDVLDDVLELFARGLAPAVAVGPRPVDSSEGPRSTPLSRTDRGDCPDPRRIRDCVLTGRHLPRCRKSGDRDRWNQGPFDMTNLNFF